MLRNSCKNLRLVGGLVAAMWATGTLALAQPIGHDIDISDLPSVQHYGSADGKHAYAVGFVVCNVGDENVDWFSNTSQHPVEGYSVFRLSNDRLEQIGISWMKHGFFAASTNNCGFSCNGVSGTRLGIGCSDLYSAGLNGSQNDLGPRYEVNAATGAFPYPYTEPSGSFPGTIFKRAQVKDEDLTDPDAIYFVEGLILHPDDSADGNATNNASYRRVLLNADNSMTTVGPTFRALPAIQAWKDHGNGVDQEASDVKLSSFDVVNDGRFWLGTRVMDNGDGTFRYEYGLYNMTSDRSASGFHVEVGPAVTVNGQAFKDVDYHSGEPFSNEDWTMNKTDFSVDFTSPATFAEDPDTNALRFGTMYNFTFTTNTPPRDGRVTVDLFKPGVEPDDPDTIQMRALIPVIPTCDGSSTACDADANGDCMVTQIDLGILLAAYLSDSGDANYNPAVDYDANGTVDFADLGELLADYLNDCN